MSLSFKSSFVVTIAFAFSIIGYAQKATPIFKDGEAQIVDAFSDSEKWLRIRRNH